MKKISFVLLLLFSGIIVMGQGNEKTEIRKLKPFDKIRISKGINVTLQEGDEPQAEVIITNAELEDVLIQQNGREVSIKMKTKIYKEVIVNVYVTFQNLREISAGTGGSIDADDIIEADQLVLEAGMDASIELEIEVNKLKASASTARIQVSGTAEYIEVNTSTGGRFLGAELECKEAFIKTNTGGSAQVFVTDKLEASAGSGAKIEYSGNPEKVNVKTTLGGKIEEM